MTHKVGRISNNWVKTHGHLTENGVSLKATNHLTEPRSYAGTPAAVPPQIYTDEDCENMPQPGPRNFAERSYAGVYREEDCDDTPTRGPRNFGKRTYSGRKKRLKGRRRRRKRFRRHATMTMRPTPASKPCPAPDDCKFWDPINCECLDDRLPT